MDHGLQPGMMKFCVAANVVRERTEEDGTIRHGTPAYPGGRKVYVAKHLRLDPDVVCVLGMNRFKKYVYNYIPLGWIENVRPDKTFNLHLLTLMRDNFENFDMWWGYREEDRQGVALFAEVLNRLKAGDRTAAEQYCRKRYDY